MHDITGAKLVEIEIRDDGKVVWLHVNGATVARICSIETLEITDHRPNQEPPRSVDFNTAAAPSESVSNASQDEPVASQNATKGAAINAIDSSGWRHLLVLPIQCRPPQDSYHAEVIEGVPHDQFKVTTNGEVWLHPAASELAVRFAVYKLYDAPQEVLGLPVDFD